MLHSNNSQRIFDNVRLSWDSECLEFYKIHLFYYLLWIKYTGCLQSYDLIFKG